ncbi:hypothetical protein Lesp02_05560 [Lentzea sp. NBRC 105346]|uniref:VOC family protein n=1 Tax=Lentzea sp. NBRC 105346 TaxID=3032205 RepID=UPI0024A495B5|nr:VOC family protein [Lentzea sp. NBRC 105346]GLZ28366.1 hypothetical protein Lesp02_05560 [Lentzea sp. NBRC 105346]
MPEQHHSAGSCGLRRLELFTPLAEPSVDFYAAVLGWAVIADPDGSFTGWVGDRLAAAVRPGDSPCWHVVFGGPETRSLRDPSDVDAWVDGGRVLHGPWAPEPRAGEPCWAELMSSADTDDYWSAQLGWEVRSPSEEFLLYESSRRGDRRAVAGRLRTLEPKLAGWMVYFAVGSVAKACERVAELGGTVLVPPTSVPTGLVASIADPAGGVCALLESPPGWGGTWSS